MIGAAHLELYRAKPRRAADALGRTDALTGLANRRALIEAAEASLPEVLALVIFDIDRFKGVNDSFGHLAGDAVLLRSVGLMMDEELKPWKRRPESEGEEFSAAVVGRFARRAGVPPAGLRDRLRSTPILVGDLTVRVTMSAGVALREGCDSLTGSIRTPTARSTKPSGGTQLLPVSAQARSAGQPEQLCASRRPGDTRRSRAAPGALVQKPPTRSAVEGRSGIGGELKRPIDAVVRVQALGDRDTPMRVA